MDDDYKTELPKGSVSMQAAVAGDEAIAASRADGSQFRLPPIAFSSAHSEEKEQEFRAMAEGYSRGHNGKGTGNAAYRELTAQADAYKADALNLEESNAAYNQLVPQSAFALESVVRFKGIQAELGLDFSDGPEWTVMDFDLDTHVADRKGELAKGLSAGDVKTNKGQVSDAARAFTAAQTGLYSAINKLQGHTIRNLIKQLQAERSEQSEKKETIESAIENAHSLTEFVGSALGFSNDMYAGSHKLKGGEHSEHGEHHERSPEENVERNEGRFEVASGANEAAGVVLGAVMFMIHDEELAAIEAKMNTLGAEIGNLEGLAEAKEAQAIFGEFSTAKAVYTAALHHYENSLASRRTAYAKAGTKADHLHEGSSSSLKHGKDKAAQTMLFISAARETDVVLRTALPTGKHAEDVLRKTLRGLEHRTAMYLEDDWLQRKGEGGNTPDRQQTFDAFSKTIDWIQATENEIESFDPIEANARKMLEKTGKTSGEY